MPVHSGFGICRHRTQVGPGLVQDLLAHLRPSLERLTSFPDAAQAVAALEASEARSAAGGPVGLGSIEEEDSDSDESADNSGSDSDNEGVWVTPMNRHKWLCATCN